jgi:F-type H+-transporting ATPase subunit b
VSGSLRSKVAGAALAAAALVTLSAAAQQPPPAGQPPLPPGHPPVLQPGQPGQAPPALPPRPGQPPRPTTVQRAPIPAPPTRRAAPKHEEEEAAAHPAHCPGHGPLDPPGHVNLWRGLIGVDNEKAESGSGLDKLLWRYNNEHDPCDPKNEPPPFLATILNFVVLAYLVVRFGKKPVGEALVKRKDTIMVDIETAARLKNEAKKRLADYEKKSATIEETLTQLRTEYAQQAELEKKRILAEAEERKARMKRDAEFRIEQELKGARIEILNEAVEKAAGQAEELVKKQMSKTDADRLNDEYLASLGAALDARGGAA